MSAETFFDAARALKRELTGDDAIGLTQAEVDAFEAITGKWERAAPLNPAALADAAAFFKIVRNEFGALDQSQVDGFQALLQAFGVARWPTTFAAYALATAWHETAARMQPVKEAYWLSEDWRKANLHYFPWYGRGYVQLTWEKNYRRADAELGLNGALVADRDLALKPDIAARIMVHGMADGWFTGKRLGHYLPLSKHAGFDAYKEARRIINGTDKWEAIAKQALQFESALTMGGWA